ncbi:MAG TPA: endonuclease/exonuclease/phosphatase family protein [Kofleriaceae bacterium]|jgi:endonuclease/exonuclease/phosphatase (EEP) superfamily protein YafD
MKRGLVALLSIAAVGFAVAWLLSLVPAHPLVLLQHFYVQLAAVGAVVAAAAVALRAPYADAAVAATVLTWLLLAPDLLAARRPVPDGAPLRVLMLNVHTESSSFADVRQLIADVNPDVVGLVEVDQRWIAGVAPAVAGYAGRLERPRGDNFGVALYTRAPLTGAIDYFGGELPVAVGAASGVTFVLLHPLPPMTSAAIDQARDEMDAVATRVRSLAGPVVLLGDLNATPWSRPYRHFLAASGLCDSRAGFGWESTWPAGAGPLRIPLDHLWASCSVGVAARVVERDVGSDHLPVVVDLVVPR